MSNNQQMMLNRIKVVLAEKQRTNRWLATQMGKSENTISRWCSNKSQPSIIQLQEIANLLDVDIRQLLTTTKDNNAL
jgi:Helix-turn-helix.